MSNLVEIKKSLSDPKMLSQFKLALPANVTPEKFQRVAMTAVLNNADVAMCTVQSVMTSLLKCAQDGLLPDNREAAIVKYKDQAQYMPMVYGIIKRMRNSGSVTNVNAYCVYANDIFDYEIENGVERIRHKPCINGNRGEFILAYAVIGIEDSNPHIEVMLKEDIDKARKSSKAPNSPAWTGWYEEMAKKCVLHRAGKRVPTSSEAAEFMGKDMKVMLNGGFADELPDEPPKTTLVDSINEGVSLQPDQQIIDQLPDTQQQDTGPVVSDEGLFPDQ